MMRDPEYAHRASAIRALRSENRLAEARAAVEEHRAQYSEDPAWDMEIGIQLYVEGDSAAALAVFEVLARIEGFPGQQECLLRCGEIYMLQERFAESAAAYDLADAKFPGYRPMSAVRARLADAVRAHDVAQALQRARERLQSAEEIEGLVELLAGAVRDLPTHRHLRMELGRYCRLARRSAQAIENLLPLIEDDLFVGQLESMIELARAYHQAGDEAAAWAICQRVGRKFPRHAAFSLLAAELRPGRTDASLQVMAEAYAGLEGTARAQASQSWARNWAATKLPDLFSKEAIDAAAVAAQPGSDPLGNAAIIMLTKDEADILGQNLRHHHRLGFRNFCIIDNASTDATADIVREFREAHADSFVFYCHDPITGYYQGQKMALFQDMFVRYLAIEGIAAEWMFFLDTDEFLGFGNGGRRDALRDAMANPAVDVIVFHWVLMASHDRLDATPDNADPFIVFPAMRLVMPPAEKVALRVGRGLVPSFGNHWMESYDGPLEAIHIMAEHGWFMFHFAVRSVAQMRSKVRNGGAAFLASKGLEGLGGHWKTRHTEYERDGEAYIARLVAEHVESVSNRGKKPGQGGEAS